VVAFCRREHHAVTMDLAATPALWTADADLR
jgi:hypothetical protein